MRLLLRREGETCDISGDSDRTRRAAAEPNEFITRREIRETRLPVIRVKEKEVSASARVKKRIAEVVERGGLKKRTAAQG